MEALRRGMKGASIAAAAAPEEEERVAKPKVSRARILYCSESYARP